MDSEERVLPLFPLNTVLFPGAALPLQIFEERYKEMLQDCLAADSWFGAVLIKEGVEVGGPAVPHTTGTVAEIVQVSDEQRGRFLISCVGRQRFHIKSISDELPYLSGSVELLAEEADQGVTPELTAAVREAVAAYLALVSGLGAAGSGTSRSRQSPSHYRTSPRRRCRSIRRGSRLSWKSRPLRRVSGRRCHFSTDRQRSSGEGWKKGCPRDSAETSDNARQPPSIPSRSKTSASLATPSPISSGVL